MKVSLKFIILGVSVILAASLILVVWSVASVGINLSEQAQSNMTQIITTDDVDYLTKIAGNLSGDRVKVLASEFNESGVYTQIITKSVPTGFYSITNLENVDSPQHVDDKAVFSGEVVRNKNDVVIAVQFIEKGMDAKKFDLEEAVASTDFIEMEMVKEQYRYYLLVAKNFSVCRESLKAYRALASAMRSYDSAATHLAYKETTHRADADPNTGVLIPLYRSQKEFYEKLTNTIKNEWLPNNWFNALIYYDSKGNANDSGGYYDPADLDNYSPPDIPDDGDLDDDDDDSGDDNGFSDFDITADDGKDDDDDDPSDNPFIEDSSESEDNTGDDTGGSDYDDDYEGDEDEFPDKGEENDDFRSEIEEPME